MTTKGAASWWTVPCPLLCFLFWDLRICFWLLTAGIVCAYSSFWGWCFYIPDEHCSFWNIVGKLLWQPSKAVLYLGKFGWLVERPSLHGVSCCCVRLVSSGTWSDIQDELINSGHPTIELSQAERLYRTLSNEDTFGPWWLWGFTKSSRNTSPQCRYIENWEIRKGTSSAHI